MHAISDTARLWIGVEVFGNTLGPVDREADQRIGAVIRSIASSRRRRPAHTRLALSLGRDEHDHTTSGEFKAIVAAALAGHAAEHIVFGEISTASKYDIQMATSIARDMVERYGMSEGLGTVALAAEDDPLLPPSYSDRTTASIDLEIRHIIDFAYGQAASIITAHRDALDRVAQALQERGTLQGDELESLIRDQE